MIMKLLFGRAMPAGAAALLLHSSYSPIQPALSAFAAATNALAGQSTQDSGAHFAGTEGQPPLDIPTSPDAAVARAKGDAKGMFGSLFGGSDNKAAAQAQLDAVIADVKYHGHPPADVPQPHRAPTPQNPGEPPPPRGEVRLSRVKGKAK